MRPWTCFPAGVSTWRLAAVYDRREYVPFGAEYMDSLELMDEGVEVIQKAWNSPGKWSHKGRFFDIPR